MVECLEGLVSYKITVHDLCGRFTLCFPHFLLSLSLTAWFGLATTFFVLLPLYATTVKVWLTCQSSLQSREAFTNGNIKGLWYKQWVTLNNRKIRLDFARKYLKTNLLHSSVKTDLDRWSGCPKTPWKVFSWSKLLQQESWQGPEREHISPTLASLHWRLVNSRTEFKFLLTFKGLE